MRHFWNGIWVLFAAGILIMIVSFFGCCGAISESPVMLAIVRVYFKYNNTIFKQVFRRSTSSVIKPRNLFRYLLWLGQYSGFLGLCFIIQLAGAAYTLDNGIEYSKLTDWGKWKFYDLVTKFETDTRARRIGNMIQEFVSLFWTLDLFEFFICRFAYSISETGVNLGISS
jgi:hypothetical protein